MELAEKINMVKAMSKGAAILSENDVASYLAMAESAIMNRVYPMKDISETELPSRYDYAQVRIAVYNINKRGAEGESKHIEVGTERDYSSADIPDDLLSELVPFCGVPM